MISAAELQQHQAEAWRVFDCRFRLGDPDAGAALYRQGHLPGAQYLHMDRDLASPITPTSGRHPLPDASVFAERLRACGLNNGAQVVCYDDVGGAFAARLWWLLHWLGHESVAVLDGGVQAWSAAGYGLTDEVPEHAHGDFQGEPQSGAWLQVDDIIIGLQSQRLQLLDARTPARFTGEDQQTDPVPGHVPGAISAPFQDNLTQQGTFRSIAELQTRYAELINSDKDTAIMCGSGVTACHNCSR